MLFAMSNFEVISRPGMDDASVGKHDASVGKYVTVVTSILQCMASRLQGFKSRPGHRRGQGVAPTPLPRIC